MKIEVKLADRDVGSEATVTEKRWFREPIITKYICIKSSTISGGTWVNVETNEEPNMDLSYELNKAAQEEATKLLNDIKKKLVIAKKELSEHLKNPPLVTYEKSKTL